MYAWTRFWRARADEPHLAEGSLLYDPTGAHTRYLNPGATGLAGVGDRVAALLGDPGMGKTSAVRDYAATDPSVTVVDLADVVTPEGARAAVDLTLSASAGVVTVVYDGLDEVVAGEPRAGDWLVAALAGRPEADLARLRVRVCCRPAVWSERLGGRLARRLGQDAYAPLVLLPLRREDVLEAAAALAVDGDAFLDELRRRDVLAFAARPVTLAALLLDYRDGALPADKTGVYESLTVRLASELNPARHDAGPARTRRPELRLDVASRIAAVALLSRRPTVWRGADARDVRAGELRLGDLGPGVAPADVDDALDTGLFASAGDDRLRFAHRTYGEFLASRQLHRTNLPTADALALVLDWTGRRVQPQLGEVAAWLAAYRPDAFEALLGLDTGVLLRSDVATRSSDDRRRLLVAVLGEQDLDPAPAVDHDALARLADDRLAPELTEFLTGPGHSDRARSAALTVAGVTPAMQPVLLDLVCDGSAGAVLRAGAARRLDAATASSSAPRLAALLDTGPVDDELRGIVLRALWPSSIGTDEVLARCAAVPVRVPRRLSSAYTHFLAEDLPQTVPDADLGTALRWAAANDGLSEDHGTCADHLLARALARPGVADADAVARLYLSRQSAYGRGREAWTAPIEVLREDRDARRRLLASVVALGGDDHAQRLVAVRLPLPEDFGFALRSASEPGLDPAPRRRWVHVADVVFRYDDDPGQLDDLWDARGVPEVHDTFVGVLDGVPLDGPAAAAGRANLLAERELGALRARIGAAGHADPVAVAAALADVAPGAWRALWHALEPDGPLDWDVDVASVAAWARLGDDDRRAAVRLAGRWVASGEATGQDADGRWSDDTLAELRALLLVDDDDGLLGSLTRGQWGTWAAPLVGIAGAGTGAAVAARVGALIVRAYRAAPDAVVTAMTDGLDREAAAAADDRDAAARAGRDPDPLLHTRPVVSHTRLYAVWDDALGDALVGWQRGRPDGFGLLETVPFLVSKGRADAATLAVDALADPAANDAGRRRRVAGAGALLAWPGGAEHWDDVWAVWSTDPDLGRAVLDSLPRGPGWELPGALAALDEDRLARLAAWLLPRAGALAGRGDRLSETAAAVLDLLVERATPAAVDALAGLAAALPGVPELPYRLRDARTALAVAAWSPPPPRRRRRRPRRPPQAPRDQRRRARTGDRRLAGPRPGPRRGPGPGRRGPVGPPWGTRDPGAQAGASPQRLARPAPPHRPRRRPGAPRGPGHARVQGDS